jgi:predicted DNA-binding transcriptional regulator YafY
VPAAGEVVGLPRNNQIVRILSLARTLAASRRGISLKDLALREGWSWRAVYRDKDALEAAGFPIEEHTRGRYRMREDWAAPNLPDVRPEEIAAFFGLRALAETWRGTTLGRPLDNLWAKLTAGPTRQGALVPATRQPWLSVRSPIAIDYRNHDKTIAVLERAVKEHLIVDCRYRALSTREITTRHIEPGDLHWDPALETLYVLGWCRLRSEVRIFAVHRFLAVSLTDERFLPRPETRSKNALKNAFRIWRGANIEAVKVRFSPEAAPEIRERHWSAGQTIHEESDGGVVLTMEVANPMEVERWVLGFGPAAEALAPDALRSRVISRTTEAAAKYSPREPRGRKPARHVPPPEPNEESKAARKVVGPR